MLVFVSCGQVLTCGVQFTKLDSTTAWCSEMWVNVDNGSGQVRLVLDYTPKGVKMDLSTMPLSEYIKVLTANDPQVLYSTAPSSTHLSHPWIEVEHESRARERPPRNGFFEEETL